MNHTTLLSAVVLALTASGFSNFPITPNFAIAPNFQDAAKPAAPAAETKPARAAAKVEVPFFGNEKCPISGEAIDKSSFAELEGQLVYFCCKKCLAKGKEDAKGTVDKAYPRDKVADLKNTVCPVMDEAIEDPKDKYTIVVMGRKINMCCDDCLENVKEAPTSYLAKAMNPKLKEVGNSKCPVTGEAVSRNDVAIYNGKIVRLSSVKAVESFQKDPDKFLADAEKGVKKPDKKL